MYYTYVYIYIYIYISTCMYIMCVYIYIYIYIYTHHGNQGHRGSLEGRGSGPVGLLNISAITSFNRKTLRLFVLNEVMAEMCCAVFGGTRTSVSGITFL